MTIAEVSQADSIQSHPDFGAGLVIITEGGPIPSGRLAHTQDIRVTPPEPPSHLPPQNKLVYFELLIERSVALKTGEVIGSTKNDRKVR